MLLDNLQQQEGFTVISTDESFFFDSIYCKKGMDKER